MRHFSYVDYCVEKIKEVSLGINPNLEIFEIWCKTGEGINQWSEWLLTQIQPQG
jgi:hydrogenase nickel incorporation protein HypB